MKIHYKERSDLQANNTKSNFPASAQGLNWAKNLKFSKSNFKT